MSLLHKLRSQVCLEHHNATGHILSNWKKGVSPQPQAPLVDVLAETLSLQLIKHNICDNESQISLAVGINNCGNFAPRSCFFILIL